MIRAAAETNVNQRVQWQQSFERVMGRAPTPSEIADFETRQRELGFIRRSFPDFARSPAAQGVVSEARGDDAALSRTDL